MKKYKFSYEFFSERPEGLSAFWFRVGVQESDSYEHSSGVEGLTGKPSQNPIHSGWMAWHPLMCRPKTPHAVMLWGCENHKGVPLRVEWEKPTELPGGKVGDWREAEWRGNEKAYARTEATVQYLGEAQPRRLRITYAWAYKSGQPETFGGTRWIEDLGLVPDGVSA